MQRENVDRMLAEDVSAQWISELLNQEQGLGGWIYDDNIDKDDKASGNGGDGSGRRGDGGGGGRDNVSGSEDDSDGTEEAEDDDDIVSDLTIIEWVSSTSFMHLHLHYFSFGGTCTMGCFGWMDSGILVLPSHLWL